MTAWDFKLVPLEEVACFGVEIRQFHERWVKLGFRGCGIVWSPLLKAIIVWSAELDHPPLRDIAQTYWDARVNFLMEANHESKRAA